MPDCVYAEKRLYWVISRLRNHSLWPASASKSLSLRSLQTTLRDVGFTEDSELDGRSEIPSCSIDCVYDEAKQFEEVDNLLDDVASEISDKFKEVCYWCLREGHVLEAECSHKDTRN